MDTGWVTGKGGGNSALGQMMQARVAAAHGAPDQSVNHMRAALAKVNWDKRNNVLRIYGYAAYLDDVLDVGRFYVDHDQQIIVMSTETWDTLNYDTMVLGSVIKDMTKGSSGMRFINMTEPRYGEAVRKRANAHGKDVVTAKDAIDDLQEMANALILQAQSLNRVLDPNADEQSQIFILRYAKAEHEFAKLQGRIEEVRALLDFAGVAVIAA